MFTRFFKPEMESAYSLKHSANLLWGKIDREQWTIPMLRFTERYLQEINKEPKIIDQGFYFDQKTTVLFFIQLFDILSMAAPDTPKMELLINQQVIHLEPDIKKSCWKCSIDNKNFETKDTVFLVQQLSKTFKAHHYTYLTFFMRIYAPVIQENFNTCLEDFLKTYDQKLYEPPLPTPRPIY